MRRFRKLTQTIWHCQYHIVWVPKYRFRMRPLHNLQSTEHILEKACFWAFKVVF